MFFLFRYKFQIRSTGFDTKSKFLNKSDDIDP